MSAADLTPSQACLESRYPVLYPKAVLFISRRVGDRELARDIVQDAVIKALEIDGPDKPEDFDPWFFRILVNCLRNHGRKAEVRNRYTPLIPEGLPIGSVSAGVGESRQLEILDLVMSIDRISPEERATLLELAYGYSRKEMARSRRISRSTLVSRVKRARKAVGDLLPAL